LLGGQLGGVMAMTAVQAAVWIAAGLILGVHFAAGVGGIAVLFIFSLLIGLGFGALGAFLALRTGSGEAVQGLFPLLFVGLFLSSMNLPRNLIETDWFRTVADWNPVSYMLEAIRSLVIVGWDPEALALGFGCAGGVALIALAAASSALRGQMVRT
ncbi:MAG: ABC transporter permease, partial [Thermoleophilia bacterium]